MSQPTVNDVHTDAILSNILVAFLTLGQGFASTQAFPVVGVEKQSDKYYVYPKDAWFRDEAQKRRHGTESVGSGWELSTDSYYADLWAIHKDIGDDVRWNSDPAIDLERDATAFIAGKMLLRMERDWTAKYFTAGVWGTSTTPTNLWNDYAASDPIGDIQTAQTTILLATGHKPNKLIIGHRVKNALKNHPDILARIQYNGVTQIVTNDILAQIFEVEQVVVAEGIYNSAQEGATASMSFIAGNHALLVYAPRAAGIQVASAGYTFMWNKIPGGIGRPGRIKKFRMEELSSDRVEGEAAWAHKVVSAELGYFFNGAVA